MDDQQLSEALKRMALSRPGHFLSRRKTEGQQLGREAADAWLSTGAEWDDAEYLYSKCRMSWDVVELPDTLAIAMDRLSRPDASQLNVRDNFDRTFAQTVVEFFDQHLKDWPHEDVLTG